MKRLTPLEEAIFNAGERLIPEVTHDLSQLVIHRSAYMFFRKVIESDLAIMGEQPKPIQIVDLGCGVGHGCYTLSEIPNSHVTGVEHSPESLEYARCHYSRTSITYQLADLTEFIPAMPEYDYVISRNVFEHIPNGLQLALSTKWRYRLLFDIPYNEPRGLNPHHVLHGIREVTFSEFPGVTLFFEDTAGVIYDALHKPPRPKTVICVCSLPDLPKVGDSQIGFPLPAWQPGLGLRLRERLRRLENWPEVAAKRLYRALPERLRRPLRKWLVLIGVLPR